MRAKERRIRSAQGALLDLGGRARGPGDRAWKGTPQIAHGEDASKA